MDAAWCLMLLDASHCIYIYIKAPCCSLSRTAEQHFKFSARLLFSLSRPGLQPTSALYSFLYYLFRLAELTAAAPPTFRYCTGGTYEISDRLNLSVIYNSTFIYLYVYIPVAYILYVHICFFVAFAFVYWQPWHSADSCESSYIKEETNPNSISNHIYIWAFITYILFVSVLQIRSEDTCKTSTRPLVLIHLFTA